MFNVLFKTFIYFLLGHILWPILSKVPFNAIHIEEHEWLLYFHNMFHVLRTFWTHLSLGEENCKITQLCTVYGQYNDQLISHWAISFESSSQLFTSISLSLRITYEVDYGSYKLAVWFISLKFVSRFNNLQVSLRFNTVHVAILNQCIKDMSLLYLFNKFSTLSIIK